MKRRNKNETHSFNSQSEIEFSSLEIIHKRKFSSEKLDDLKKKSRVLLP